ncbi:hypothetical protein BDZ97DRAFT_1805554, partial [Flammula alnicola]
MSSSINNPEMSNNPDMPSHSVAPTKVDTLPQQGSTSPGDGSEVHTDGHMHQQNRASEATPQQTENVPFKERVIGVAQKTRGTIFGDAELKQHGEDILEGRTRRED